MRGRCSKKKTSILQVPARISVAIRNDVEALLAEKEGLSLIKGKWVVVNHAKLQVLLKEMEQYEGEITLLEALRGSLDADVKAGSVKLKIWHGERYNEEGEKQICEYNDIGLNFMV